jgi:hypothetical protein
METPQNGGLGEASDEMTNLSLVFFTGGACVRAIALNANDSELRVEHIPIKYLSLLI